MAIRGDGHGDGDGSSVGDNSTHGASERLAQFMSRRSRAPMFSDDLLPGH